MSTLVSDLQRACPAPRHPGSGDELDFGNDWLAFVCEVIAAERARA